MTERYDNEQKLRELLALVEFEEDGTITLNGNLLVKGNIRVTGDVIILDKEDLLKSKPLTPIPFFTTLRAEDENLRYENQRLQIETHRHRGD